MNNQDVVTVLDKTLAAVLLAAGLAEENYADCKFSHKFIFSTTLFGFINGYLYFNEKELCQRAKSK